MICLEKKGHNGISCLLAGRGVTIMRSFISGLHRVLIAVIMVTSSI